MEKRGSDKETSWIAEIDALWEDEHGEKMMECRWYYGINDMSASARPSLSQAVVALFPFECRELFETDHLSNNELGAIVQSVSVVSHEKWLELPAEKRESCFFCDYFFSTKTNYIHPLYGRHFRRFSFQDNTPAKKLERIHLYSYMNPKSSKRDSPRSTDLAQAKSEEWEAKKN